MLLLQSIRWWSQIYTCIKGCWRIADYCAKAGDARTLHDACRLALSILALNAFVLAGAFPIGQTRRALVLRSYYWLNSKFECLWDHANEGEQYPQHFSSQDALLSDDGSGWLIESFVERVLVERYSNCRGALSGYTGMSPHPVTLG